MTPTLIIDYSLAMSWCFGDEARPESTQVQNRLATEAAIVPSHWHLEVANVLVMAEKRNRISSTDSAQFLALLSTLDIQVDHETASFAFDRLPPLCRTHGLTSYDAAYLELALRLGLPLASLDDDLRKAAASVSVALLGK